MNKNYNEEGTRYIRHSVTEEETAKIISNDVNAKHDKSVRGRVAVSAGTGILIGSVATALMGMKTANPEPEQETEQELETENQDEELSNPEWVDDQMQVATSVSDDQSFGEAFAAAREEVGPGGCFEWHGKIYSTYLAEEWNSMSEEQRDEYGDHFNWSNINYSSSHVAQSAPDPSDDEIEIVSIDYHADDNDIAQTDTQEPSYQDATSEMMQAEPEIEILGVVHDNETGANIGGMTVDGHEVILIDVDGDMEFDYIAGDVNDNGQVDRDEFFDIQGQGLTVNDFAALSNPSNDIIAEKNTPDYSSDATYQE